MENSLLENLQTQERLPTLAEEFAEQISGVSGIASEKDMARKLLQGIREQQ